MRRSEQEFRDFVAGFADPLARLAYLLSAGTDLDSADMTATALASVRRQWRDVEVSGAPEPLAVEALIGALPRPSRRGRFARPAPPAVRPTHERPDDVDEAVLRAAAWDAWKTLAPRDRVPLLLDEPSIAAPRLEGIEVRQSSRSARGAAVVADWPLLREALRERVATVPTFADSHARTAQRLHRTRLRAAGAVAASVIVVVAAGAVAVRVSAPHKAKVPLVSASEVADSVSDRGPVVAWPTRGTAASNTALISKLKAAFLRAHPETTGQVQVLLLTDTSSYRLAYLTAKSPTGVLESWFYGPVGSNDLVEGVVQYGAGLDARTEFLSTGVADAQGHTQLVVLAAPGTRTMRLTTSASSTSHASRSALRVVNGLAVKSVPTGSVASYSVDVRLGKTDVVSNEIRTLALGPTFDGVAAPFEPQGVPTFKAERGQPDPQVLAQAVSIAGLAAREDGPDNQVQMKVLWGGTDPAGDHLVVVRMKMELSDVLQVNWDDNSNVPRQETADIADPSTPDAPLAFSYVGSDGPRVAVLGTPGDKSATLAVDGKPSPAVPLDATGFASFKVTNAGWVGSSPGLVVNLLGSAGNVLKTIPIPAS